MSYNLRPKKDINYYISEDSNYVSDDDSDYVPT